MKRKDFILIGVVVVISAVLSVIISSNFITSPEDRKQKVEVVEPLSTNFDRPSEKYFNKDSVNPTQTIEIGENPNDKPFGTE